MSAAWAAASAVGLWVGAIAAAVVPRRYDAARRLRPHLVVSRTRLGLLSTHSSQVVAPTGSGRRVLAAMVDSIERRSDAEIELLLERAGVPDTPAAQWRATQARAAAVGAVLGAGIALSVVAAPIAVAGGCALGGFVGRTRVRGRIDRACVRRCEAMESELLAVDLLLALHVRSGAGPLQAVEQVCRRGRGELVGELRGVLDRIRHGEPAPDAYRRAAARTVCPAAARTYALIATASERGADLGAALLRSAADLRAERRHGAHRRATRRRAAMLVPTVAVLAPVMLLLIAAPLPSIVLTST